MAKPSRRSVVSGLAAAPLAGQDAGQGADPLAETVAGWMADRALMDDLVARWGRLERRLLAQGGRGPEFEQLGDLDRLMAALAQGLDAKAGQAAALPALGVAGARAKLDLALRLMEPGDGEPHVRALVAGARRGLGS